MERYKLKLSYDGSEFAGSQRQVRRRTVQGELEKALRLIGWTGRSLILAGRTDAGVHAVGQVAAFDLAWNHGLEALREALNANLPADMAVGSIEVAQAGFHPRFDATSRRYRYRLYCQPTRDPLRERQAWRVWPEVSLEALKQIAPVLCGRHDFAAFGSAPGRGGSTVRTVTSAEWQESGDERLLEVEADAFLYRMVRRLVFVQVACAQGRTMPGAVDAALRGGSRARPLPAGLAPAHGLALIEVNY